MGFFSRILEDRVNEMPGFDPEASPFDLVNVEATRNVGLRYDPKKWFMLMKVIEQ